MYNGQKFLYIIAYLHIIRNNPGITLRMLMEISDKNWSLPEISQKTARHYTNVMFNHSLIDKAYDKSRTSVFRTLLENDEWVDLIPSLLQHALKFALFDINCNWTMLLNIKYHNDNLLIKRRTIDANCYSGITGLELMGQIVNDDLMIMDHHHAFCTDLSRIIDAVEEEISS